LLASFCDGSTTVRNVLESEDTEVMINALNRLGVDININKEQHTCHIVGNSQLHNAKNPNSEHLFLEMGNAGTVIRPLTAMLSFGEGKYVLDGVKRMRERPIYDLVQSLQQLGCGVTCINGFPPVTIDTNVRYTHAPPLHVLHTEPLLISDTIGTFREPSQYIWQYIISVFIIVAHGRSSCPIRYHYSSQQSSQLCTIY